MSSERKQKAGREGREARRLTTGGPMIGLVLPSRIRVLGEADAFVGCLAKALGFDEHSHDDIRSAVHEALVNAILHGNGGDEARYVTLRFALHADRLEILIQDEGRGFDARSVPNPLAPENLSKPSGRGILLMRALMDEVTFRRLVGGMEVTLVKRLPLAEGQARTSDGAASNPHAFDAR
jgi:serine/threonine-protein kinase RsbW